MRNYVPLSELSDYEDRRLIWRVELPPYAPAEQIGINTRRLGKLARLGGLESLRVATYAGETTKVTPGIDSVDEFGQATASMSAAETKADLQQNNLSSFEDIEIPYEYQWQKGSILINSSELDYRIGEKGKLRDPQAWAKELNEALKLGIKGASEKSLIEKVPLYEKMRTPTLLGIFAVMDTLIDRKYNLNTFEHELTSLEFYQIFVVPMLDRILRHAPIRERKLSLIPGLPIDRLFAVEGLSSALPLAKAIRAS